MTATFKTLPSWLVGWLFISSIICTIDAVFVLGRPETFDWKIYSLYRDIYIHVDKQYGMLEHGFVIAQSWLNLVEVLINIICIIFYFENNVVWSNILTYAVSIMTFWKTILYQLTDACGGPKGFVYTRHNSIDKLFLYYILPNGVWAIIPLIIIYKLTIQFTKGNKIVDSDNFKPKLN